jgi:hypothetical protein
MVSSVGTVCIPPFDTNRNFGEQKVLDLEILHNEQTVEKDLSNLSVQSSYIPT